MRFIFQCMLRPGIYFVNVGVSAMVDGERRFLDRWLDAAPWANLGAEGDPNSMGRRKKKSRTEARRAFDTDGLPGRRTEAWKYTRLSRLTDIALRIATSDDSGATVDVPTPTPERM